MTKRPTEAEILAQLAAADARETAERMVGLRAAEVRYDRKSHRFVLELTSGYSVGVPTRSLPHLAEATAAQLAEVKVDLGGSSIRIPALDADYSVPGLVLAITARETGRRGGLVRSPAKSLAAKVNGAKGGRPRKAAGSS